MLNFSNISQTKSVNMSNLQLTDAPQNNHPTTFKYASCQSNEVFPFTLREQATSNLPKPVHLLSTKLILMNSQCNFMFC